MRRLYPHSLIALLTFTLGLFSPLFVSQIRDRIDSKLIEAEGVKLTYQFHKALEDRDKESLNGILADDFQFTTDTNMGPDTMSKVELIEKVMKFETKELVSTSNINAKDDKAKVMVAGDISISYSQQKLTGRFTHIYMKRQGRLQLIAAEYKLPPVSTTNPDVQY